MHLILADKEEINSKDKTLIEDLKEFSTQYWRIYIVFDKKDVTSKNNIEEFKVKMLKQEFYTKVDAKISFFTRSNNIIKHAWTYS